MNKKEIESMIAETVKQEHASWRDEIMISTELSKPWDNQIEPEDLLSMVDEWNNMLVVQRRVRAHMEYLKWKEKQPLKVTLKDNRLSRIGDMLFHSNMT